MKPEVQKNLLFILVPSTILVIFWIIFSVYDKSTTSTISAAQTQAIQSISPVFPTGVLADLKKRTVIDPLYSIDSLPIAEGSESAVSSINPTPTINISQATNSALVEP